ncbi:MAG: O-antigen ligase family protein [Patescibacteria group bacterium]
MLKRLKLTKNHFSIFIAFLIFFIPLYPKFPLFNVSSTYVAIRVEDIIVGLIIALWLVFQFKNKFSFLKDRVNKFVLLFFVVGGLSVLSALLITKNISPHIAFLHFFRRIEYMSLFFIAQTAINSKKNLKINIFVLLIVSLIVSFYGLGQKYFDWPVVSTMNKEFSKGLILELSEWARVNSTFAGHYDLAAFLGLALGIIAGLFVYVKKRILKIFIGTLGFICLYVLVLTASRVSFVAYLGTIVFVFLLLKRYAIMIPVLIISLTLMLFSADFVERYARTFNIDPAVITRYISFSKGKAKDVTESVGSKVSEAVQTKAEKERQILLESTPTQATVPLLVTVPSRRVATESMEWKPTTEIAIEYSSGIRFDVEWPRALRAFSKNPFLGTGYSSVTLATDNDYLRMLAEVGLLGFLSFLLIFAEIGRRFTVFLKGQKDLLLRISAISIVGVGLGFFATASFIDVFEASKVAFIFWILAGSLVGLMKLNLSEDEI